MLESIVGHMFANFDKQTQKLQCDACRPTKLHKTIKKYTVLLCGSVYLLRRHVFLQIDQQFYKIWWFFIKFVKFMPAIVLCIASRGHKTWKTQCLHRLRVEIGPPMPQTHFKMRRCCADLMFCSGGTFFDKSINNFTKSDVCSWNSLNACQLSWFPLLREATTCEKLNGCTDCVLKLAHPCPKPISKWGAAVGI